MTDPGSFLVPPEPPRPVRDAGRCWTALLLISVANLAINLIIGISGLAAGYIPFGLAALAFANSRKLAAGQRSGRTAATAFGAVLAVLQVFGLVVLLAGGVFASMPGVLVALFFIVSAVVVGLVVAAMVLMFRPEVEAFLPAR